MSTVNNISTITAKELKHFTPTEAFEFINKHTDALLIDVRSETEFLLVGHPKGAISIPWFQDPDWEPNPDFLKHLLKVTGTTLRPVLFICRSGRRSVTAGEAALQHGFERVYNVLDGFEGDLSDSHQRSVVNGWRYECLPWEQC